MCVYSGADSTVRHVSLISLSLADMAAFTELRHVHSSVKKNASNSAHSPGLLCTQIGSNCTFKNTFQKQLKHFTEPLEESL